MKVLFVQIVIIKQLDYDQVAFSPVRIFLGKMSKKSSASFICHWMNFQLAEKFDQTHLSAQIFAPV